MLEANNEALDSMGIKPAKPIHELGMEITMVGIGDEGAAETVRTKTTAEVVLIDDPAILLDRSRVTPFGSSMLLRSVGAVASWGPRPSQQPWR